MTKIQNSYNFYQNNFFLIWIYLWGISMLILLFLAETVNDSLSCVRLDIMCSLLSKHETTYQRDPSKPQPIQLSTSPTTHHHECVFNLVIIRKILIKVLIFWEVGRKKLFLFFAWGAVSKLRWVEALMSLCLKFIPKVIWTFLHILAKKNCIGRSVVNKRLYTLQVYPAVELL